MNTQANTVKGPSPRCDQGFSCVSWLFHLGKTLSKFKQGFLIKVFLYKDIVYQQQLHELRRNVLWILAYLAYFYCLFFNSKIYPSKAVNILEGTLKGTCALSEIGWAGKRQDQVWCSHFYFYKFRMYTFHNHPQVFLMSDSLQG